MVFKVTSIVARVLASVLMMLWVGVVHSDECSQALGEFRIAEANLKACETGGCEEDGEARRRYQIKMAAYNRYTALLNQGKCLD